MEFVWEIKGYDGATEIFAQTIPLNDADEAAIRGMLKALASKTLTPSEIAAGFADVYKDDVGGNRIILHAGENPHYVASLWSADELAKRS